MLNPLSNEKESLPELLSEKLFRSEYLSFVTNRQVHHWKEIGLIDDHRKYAASGMKSSFNFYEALWIRLITEIRAFQISNLMIREVKKYLFDSCKENRTETTEEGILFEASVQDIIIKNQVRFLIILNNKSIKILDKTAFFEAINDRNIDHHFSLRLDILVWKILALLDFEPKIQKIVQGYKNTSNE
ncbi:hypothetical protein [Aquimarina sp. RZ0]|uniref:hypothetical protein n=1 Tax=Aquimarina sp. RZ0 TaxID=2607730 RepID=UPI0011F32B52|nr:hypothetical protein [Aquimarina sp. RZ0]KAA1239359.1 hypothetical protein F0000_27390 [Aquimarina sp. RZ0]